MGRPNAAIVVTLALLGADLEQTAWSSDQNKSGVSPTVLSLPSGPGSIEGLGESFEPQLNSGTASYAITFAAPPGRAGFAPTLGLSYDSGRGADLAGLGWRLNLPYLQRQTDKGLPFYTDAPELDGVDNDRDGSVDEPDEWDTILYSNGEELVPLADGSFRFETESSFTRFQRDADPERDGEGWVATDRDGTRHWLGITPQGRIQDAEGRIFRWLLEASEDTNGNRITYTHASLDDSAQRYCTRIDYNRDMQVQFDYAPRPDVISDYRPTYQLKTARRLTAVRMRAGEEPVREYQLGYAETSDAQPLSLLTSVTQVGRDGSSSLPPAEFDYVAFTGTSAAPVSMPSAPLLTLGDASIDLFDINADGLPDILRTDDLSTVHDYYLNLGPDEHGVVRWAERASTVPPTRLDLASADIQAADLDGDGRADLIRRGTSDVQVYRTKDRASSPGWETGPLITQALFNFADASTRLVDLNHDKRIDVMRTTSFDDVSAWLNLSDGASQRWSSAFEPVLPSSSLGLDRPEVRFADMNGDRLQDLVRVMADSLTYYPSRGFGQFGPGVPMDNPPWGILDQQRLLLADVNGDGRADALYISGGQVRTWLNLGLNPADHARARFADAFSVPAPYTNSYSVFRQADVNGNGSVDVLWSTNPGGGADTFAYLDFAPGEQPYQLKRITNGIGLTTTVHYRSSVQDWLRDREAGASWPETLPMPVQVIARIETHDGLDGYSTSYRYHQGHYDGIEQAFRGFAAAEQQEHGDASAPDLITAYRFDTGTEHEALKGKPLELEARTLEGGVFYRENYGWRVRTLATALAGDGAVSFAYQHQRLRTIIEQGNGPQVQLRWDYEYDDYGNRTRLTEHGRLDGDWDDERVTHSRYSAEIAANRDAWIINGPIERTISDENGARVAHSRTYYDGSDRLGEIDRGNPTLVERWVADDEYIQTERKAYDDHGNVIALYDPLYDAADAGAGHYRTLDYDSTYHSFPIAEHIHTGERTLTMRAAYDTALGKITRSTEFNGHATGYRYDTFGRLVAIIKPGDTEQHPTEVYDYVLANDIGDGRLVNWVQTGKRETAGGGTVDSRTFFDGLGRAVMTRAEGEDPGQVVVSDTVQFNARKQPWRNYLPYFEQGSLDYSAPTFASPFTEHQHDALGRETRMTQPDGSFSTTTYTPLAKTVRDEEQTNPASKHHGAAMRYVEDGLQNDDGNGRLREVYEIVKLTDLGEPTDTPVEWRTSYRYDLLDNFIGYTDSQNNQKFIDYDGLGRKTFMNDPDRGHMRYVYDAASNLIRTHDAKQQTIRYTYDGANRLKQELYSAEDPTPDVEYHYDQPQGPLGRGAYWGEARTIAQTILDGTEADPDQDRNQDGVIDVADVLDAAITDQSDQVTAANTLGMLTWVDDQSGEEHRSYDPRGRVAWTLKRIDDHKGNTHAFYSADEYDAMDRVTRHIYPDGSYADYRYNPRGLLESIPGVITQYDYNPAGQNAVLALANGVTTTYSYDNRLRLKRLHSLRERDGVSLQDLNYTYDGVSNIVAITDGRDAATLTTIGGEIGIAADEAQKFDATQTFVSDDLYRLVEAANQDVFGAITYRYDRIGNLVHKDASGLTDPKPALDLGAVTNGGTAGTSGRIGRAADDLPGPHALTSSSGGQGEAVFLYDANGNMVNHGVLSLSWDAKDRLLAVTNKDLRSEYRYDFSDNRTLKALLGDNSLISSYSLYVDQQTEVRSDRLHKYVQAGGRRIFRSLETTSTLEEENNAYFLHDHIISCVNSLNGVGESLGVLAYYPYGEVRIRAHRDLSVAPHYYTFSGKERDHESDLYYSHRRYLSQLNGSFVSVDPLYSREIKDSSDTRPYSNVGKTPRDLNLYSYAYRNPPRFVDLQGLNSTDSTALTLWSAGRGLDAFSAALGGGTAATVAILSGAVAIVGVSTKDGTKNIGAGATVVNLGANAWSVFAAGSTITAAGAASALSVGIASYQLTEYAIGDTYLDGGLGESIYDWVNGSTESKMLESFFASTRNHLWNREAIRARTREAASFINDALLDPSRGPVTPSSRRADAR